MKSSSYRATCDSYGFRSRYWTEGDIATNVKEEEKIPPHFALITGDEPEPEPEEKEAETLSEIQEQSIKPKKLGRPPKR